MKPASLQSARPVPRATGQGEPSHSQALVVTLLSRHAGGGAVLWSEIWDGQAPLGVGTPFGWFLERRRNSLRLTRAAPPNRVTENACQEFAIAPFKRGSRIPLSDRLELAIHQARSFDESDSAAPDLVASFAVSETPTDRLFQRTAVSVSLTLLLFFLGLRLAPKPATPEKKELIPPQFAKTLLSPALKKQATDKKSAGKSSARGKSVVMAFKSKAVEATTKSLLDPKLVQGLMNQAAALKSNAPNELVRKVFDKTSGSAAGKLAGLAGLAKGNFEKVAIASAQRMGAKAGAGYESARDAKVVGQGTGAVDVSSNEATASEGLTKDEVGRVIRQHLGEIRYCYESSLVAAPGLEGKLVVKFTINPGGAVSERSAKESSGEAKLDNCILDRLVRWKFPKPRGGVNVGITYPFIFKSLGG